MKAGHFVLFIITVTQTLRQAWHIAKSSVNSAEWMNEVQKYSWKGYTQAVGEGLPLGYRNAGECNLTLTVL